MPTIIVFGTEINVLAQAAGLAGLVLFVIAYQQKRMPLLVLQLVGCFFCLAESLILLGWIGAVITTCGIVRNSGLIFWQRRGVSQPPPQFTVILIAIMWLSCLPFYLFAGEASDWFNFLPPVLMTISSVCAASKSLYVLKGGAFVHESGFLFYQLGIGAYIGAARQIILSLGVIVGIITTAVKSKRDSQK